MEFLNNHIKIADEELKKLTAFSINSLKSDSENGISVTKAIDNIRRKIWDEFIETSFIYHYKDHFEEVYRIYRLSLSNYNKDKVDEVKSVLKNEAYDEFLMRLKINKVSNYTYGEDFDNITYETFVTHMLKYDVYKKCYNRLSENIDLYELFYETEDYKEFTFEAFEGHVINSKLYRNLYSINYPDKKIPIAVKRIDEYQNIVYDIIENNEELNNPSGNQETKDKIKKQIFELDEQLLILNLCLEDKNSIPLTEKSKLIILIGEITEDNLFKVPSSNSKTYSKISNGIWRQGSKKTMIQIIDSILTKIENYNLTTTNQTLKKHRATLKNEQKNT